MWYRGLRTGALLLLVVLYLLFLDAVKNTPQPVMPVMQMNEAYISIEALAKSVGSINSIEYKQTVSTKGPSDEKKLAEIHYYYKKPFFLRIETKNQENINIDIYTPEGMYEYIPPSNTVYFREKWKDNKPVSYQLEDKLQDITVKGKYEVYKRESIDGVDCEIIRRVDEFDEEVYEHRVWLGMIEGFNLPVKEEYLVDGEVTSAHKYEYISINKNLDSSLFDVKNYKDIKILRIEGIPKLVKDENEAEKYVGFSVIVPKYIPEGFTLHEIFIIPPSGKPSVLISFLSDADMIYFSQKNIKKNELTSKENEKTIVSGGKKFVYGKRMDDSMAVRWVKNGIEYEVSGPRKYKNEIAKLIQSISGSLITLE